MTGCHGECESAMMAGAALCLVMRLVSQGDCRLSEARFDSGTRRCYTCRKLHPDIHWLAGLLEGEGSFVRSPPSSPNTINVSLEMTDEDVVARVAAMWGVAYCKPHKRKATWKQSFRVTVRGGPASRWMHLLRPLMGARRKGQIDAALKTFRPDPLVAARKSRRLPSPAKIRRLHKTMSTRKIAKMIGCHHSHVHRMLHM
jgi:hypothetical protein